LKTPPASILIKKELGLKIGGKPGTGSARPNKDKVGSITRSQLRKLAEMKIQDTNAASIDACILSLAGTARSMGVDVVD
jgi:large subunit ribosomal protein L11